MKTDFIYLLIDGADITPYGNLKTLVESIDAMKRYKFIWTSLQNGNDETTFGDYTIRRSVVMRAPYIKKQTA